MRRRSLSRYAHALARSGKFENAEAVISEIRVHAHFDPASHETSTFRTALNAICDVAKRKQDGQFRMPPRLCRAKQRPATAARAHAGQPLRAARAA
jgi:hypothetical protein